MEPLIVINKRLQERFGSFQGSLYPLWRVVWSEDEMEKRFGEWEDRTAEGLLIRRVKEVREVPKYRQYIQNKFILERLLEVPISTETQLVELKSYEPVWVFEDKFGNALPAKWEAIEFIIHGVYAAAGVTGYAKYKEDPKEDKAKRVAKLKEELFGNESEVGDALAHKSAIVVPHNNGVIQ